MARIFLYCIVGIIGLFLLGIAGLYIFWDEAQMTALRLMVPDHSYAADKTPPAPDYRLKESWAARPGHDPYSDRAPVGVPLQERLPVDVFFIHPTSYLGHAYWNAAIDDPAATTSLPRILVSQASPFGATARLFAPRYRQAAFGAFIANNADTQKAVATAYADIETAFDRYMKDDNNGRPFIIAGHSQGALLGSMLLKNRIDGTDLAKRLIAAYLPGWPLSRSHDVGALQDIAACATKTDTACLISWQTFGEGGNPDYLETAYRQQKGLDGQTKQTSAKLCHNPVSWIPDGASNRALHLGAVPPVLSPEASLPPALPKAFSAYCGSDGFLYISPAPDMYFSRLLLPGSNYHAYDIHLFSMDIRANVRDRASAWLSEHNTPQSEADIHNE